MSPVPRRLPPGPDERLATVVQHMTPGALTGLSRMTSPVVVSAPYRSQRGKTDGQMIGDGVPFWWDQWTLAANQAPGRFQLTYIPWNYSEHVYLNGIEQLENVAWTRPPGTAFLDVLGGMGARAGDVLEVRYARGDPPPIMGDWVQLPDWESNRTVTGNTHSATYTIIAQPGDFYPDPDSPASSQDAVDCAYNHTVYLHDGSFLYPGAGFTCPTINVTAQTDNHGSWGPELNSVPTSTVLGDDLFYPDAGTIDPAVGDVQCTTWVAEFDVLALVWDTEITNWFDRVGMPEPAEEYEWENTGWVQVSPFSAPFQAGIGTLISATMVPITALHGEVDAARQGGTINIRLQPTNRFFHTSGDAFLDQTGGGEVIATVDTSSAGATVLRDLTQADLGWRSDNPEYGQVTYPFEPDPDDADKPLVRDLLSFTATSDNWEAVSPPSNDPPPEGEPGKHIHRSVTFTCTFDFVIRPPRYRIVGA